MLEIRTIIVFCALSIAGSVLFGQTISGKINGITVVAPPQEFEKDPFPRIKETNANWVCFIPYGFGRQGETQLRYNMDRQWWGEKEEGIIESIKLARNNGLQIFLKPQIYLHRSWVGHIDFETEKEWQAWEEEYRKFILFYAKIASEYDVELFCIGTEFKISARKRPQFWKALIKEIKEVYCGKLTYSSNWDSYTIPKFWDDLDYIGISAYFPLVNKPEPSIKQIKSAWKPILKTLKKASNKYQKQVLFTEYGYLSVSGTTFENWNLEKKIRQLDVNEKAQADALEAMYASLSDKDYWAGGFLWKWFPNDRGHEGYIEKDYTVKNKKAEKVLKSWFK